MNCYSVINRVLKVSRLRYHHPKLHFRLGVSKILNWSALFNRHDHPRCMQLIKQIKTSYWNCKVRILCSPAHVKPLRKEVRRRLIKKSVNRWPLVKINAYLGGEKKPWGEGCCPTQTANKILLSVCVFLCLFLSVFAHPVRLSQWKRK